MQVKVKNKNLPSWVVVIICILVLCFFGICTWLFFRRRRLMRLPRVVLHDIYVEGDSFHSACSQVENASSSSSPPPPPSFQSPKRPHYTPRYTPRGRELDLDLELLALSWLLVKRLHAQPSRHDSHFAHDTAPSDALGWTTWTRPTASDTHATPAASCCTSSRSTSSHRVAATRRAQCLEGKVQTE